IAEPGQGQVNGRRGIERRSPVGTRLFEAVAEAAAPATFDELATLAINSGSPLREMVRWLAVAEVGGVLEHVEEKAGGGLMPRRFVLTDFGRRLATHDRRGAATDRAA